MNNELLTEILKIVLIPILPIIATYLISLLRKKISQIEINVKNDTLKKYIDIAETIIETSVATVSQIFVDDLKKKGEFGKVAHSEAFEMAKQKILTALVESVRAALCEAYGDLDKYIDSRIEYYVRQNKIKATNN